MCAYSFIADHGRDQLERYRPEPYPVIWPNDAVRVSELERRVADLEELLRKAKEYDEETGQPDCELDEKKMLLEKLAKELGVEINLP